MKKKGFTLVEILIVVTILAVTGIILNGIINPIKMIERAQDSKKVTGVQNLSTILESYNNDTGCYPNDVPFGDSWIIGKEIYMSKVPQDPDFPSESFYYVNDGTDCSKGYVIFYRQKTYSDTKNACELPEGCLPENYQPQWECKVGGKVNCRTVAGFLLPKTTQEAIAKNNQLIENWQAKKITPTPTFGPPPATEYSTLYTAQDGAWCYDSTANGAEVSFPGYQTVRMNTNGESHNFCIDSTGKIIEDYCQGNVARSPQCYRVYGSGGLKQTYCYYPGYTCSYSLGDKCSGGVCTTGTDPSPTPNTVKPQNNDLIGEDGSWCDDSDGLDNWGHPGYCQDKRGRFSDYCVSSTVVSDYHCAGHWDGYKYTNVRCERAAFNCKDFNSGLECTTGGFCSKQ